MPSRSPHVDVCWSHGWLLGWVLLFSFAVAILSFTLPLFMLLTYDRVLSARSMETLTALILLTLICLTGMGLLDYARRRGLAAFGAIFQEEVEAALLSEDDPTAGRGAMPEGAITNLDALRSFIHSGALVHIIDVLWLPLFVGVIFLLSPALGLVAMVGILAIGLVFAAGRFLSGPSMARARSARRVVRDLTGRYRRTRGRLDGQNMTKAYRRAWRDARRWARHGSVRGRDRLAAYEAAITMLRSLTWVMMLATGAALVLDGRITAGVMIAAVVLVNRILVPWVSFLYSLPALGMAARDWRHLSARFDSREDPRTSLPSPVASAPLLCLQDAGLKGIAGANDVLAGVNLQIGAGDIVAIHGASGSGKTMLCEAIALARPLDAGRRLILGMNSDALGGEQRSRLVGYVPEDRIFAPATLTENISALSVDHATPEVERAARDAGLHSDIAGLPQGYATAITEDGLPLARGQRERLALTRALYHAPRLLVVDAPSSILLEMLGRGDRGGPIDTFLARGNSLVIATRSAMKTGLPVTHYDIAGGRLVRRRPECSGDAFVRMVGVGGGSA